MTSVYELLTPFGAERHQRFWDYFDGDSLKSFWRSIQRQGGGGSAAMVDAVNEGFQLTSGTCGASQWALDLGDIQHFDTTVGVYIFQSRRSSSSGWANVGVGNDMHLSPSDHFSVWQDQGGTSFKRLQTRDGTTQSQTDSSISPDQNWTIYSCVMKSSVHKGWVNGNFEVAKTTNLPTKGGNPTVQRGTGSGHTMRIRYCEVWNT